ncbi:MAG: Gfo/Idh/MocA family oxidoreductase [Phaeodactylibacter sp.]|nr:Gfo/Idh/MocA family oxidoreductase [Phaeodactylibacter sp.]
MKRVLCFFVGALFFVSLMPAQEKLETAAPLKVGVVGLVHTHVHWILGRENRGDIQIVGIAEPNRELAQRYAKQHGFSMDIVYPSIDEMLEATRPEAVTAFNTIYGHLEVVEKCAPRGIHVMVEKPLAVSLEHARRMEALAIKHGILLLTNYETSWYGSNHAAKEMVEGGKIGPLRKIVVHDGHPGPKEIGVNKEFLEWLTDPRLNGGGALTDFGCYGANLATWLMNGQRPLSVTCVTQKFKPDVYPKVEDEATIIVTYPKTQAIIQASWNWPYNRKDIEIYGTTGYIFNRDRENMGLLFSEAEGPLSKQAPALEGAYYDPFAFLEAALRDKVEILPYDLSSLENNMIVMEILEAAKQSAKRGETVRLK